MWKRDCPTEWFWQSLGCLPKLSGFGILSPLSLLNRTCFLSWAGRMRGLGCRKIPVSKSRLCLGTFRMSVWRLLVTQQGPKVPWVLFFLVILWVVTPIYLSGLTGRSFDMLQINSGPGCFHPQNHLPLCSLLCSNLHCFGGFPFDIQLKPCRSVQKITEKTNMFLGCVTYPADMFGHIRSSAFEPPRMLSTCLFMFGFLDWLSGGA